MRSLCLLRIVVAGALLVSGLLLASQLIGRASPAFQQTELQRVTAQPTGQEKQRFDGKISRSGDRLVLEDKASKISYQLDDQQLAGLFEGKDVKITGRLDSDSNTIYISDIGLLNAKRSAYVGGSGVALLQTDLASARVVEWLSDPLLG